MTSMAVTINDMLNDLEEDDYKAAITFIQYLSDSRKKKKAAEDKKILSQIQDIFENDKGWKDEESMIADMAEFRRERMEL